MQKRIPLFVVLILFLSLPEILPAQQVDLTNAAILASPKIESPMRETVITVLQEEVEKRTGLNWTKATSWKNKNTVIAIVETGDKKLAGQSVPLRSGDNLPEQQPEGYRIISENQNDKTIIWIIGADARGVLFGAGHLLRTLNWETGKAGLDSPLDVATAPQQSVRGHQLGYRNTANSYDAWSVEQYDQYIRELALFGTNAVENIPFGDSDDSPHMQIPRAEMNIRMSEICAKYDVDYWVWTPATFDLTDSEKRTAMLNKHEEFYKACPKLDQIFFPGGDPGHNHPRDILPFLKDLTERLVKYHPNAGIWISLQGFSAEQVDYFYVYLDEHKPNWLRGVVSGPSSPPTAETRFRLSSQYKHRLYPDINHNVRCEYPVQNWDQAFSLTIGREGTNPRPAFFSKLHAQYAPLIDGFVSYSDGIHDDVNKIIWSMRGWDTDAQIDDILNDYCRFFFGSDVANAASAGILALEKNWDGPIRENGGIETTLAFWKSLEAQNPQLSENWRWQMLVLRGYYDAYQRQRNIYERGLEHRANLVLAQAKRIGAERAMDKALAIVNKADSEPIARDLHGKIVQYCDDLFRSIGLQTSVPKYQAANSQRGCILELVDHPFNNRWWLEDEFKKIKELTDEEEKLAQLEMIRSWESPGLGSYYDNVSNIAQSPHVLTTSYDATDVAWWDNGRSRTRLSSQLFQNELKLQYNDLDFNGRYILRLCGQGDALVWADGKRLEPVLYNKERGEFKEFVIPRETVGDGAMRIVIDRPEESHINWRKYSHVSDVWLIKQ
jgi:hypothetical protein